jgi:hypothetical protein
VLGCPFRSLKKKINYFFSSLSSQSEMDTPDHKNADPRGDSSILAKWTPVDTPTKNRRTESVDTARGIWIFREVSTGNGHRGHLTSSVHDNRGIGQNKQLFGHPLMSRICLVLAFFQALLHTVSGHEIATFSKPPHPRTMSEKNAKSADTK